MSLLLSALVALGLVVLGLWWLRSGRVDAPRAQAQRPSAAARPPTAAPGPTPAPDAGPPQRVVALPAAAPAELMSFHRVAAADLPAQRRHAVTAMFSDVPRPPRLLHHLLSPEFLHAAESSQLVELISAEPLIAARVLGAVNSPLYGLQRPVHSVGQAVTYLGLNAVRSLCLQYVLVNAFRADTPQRQQVLQRVWCASALASELSQQLGQRLGWSDAGLVSSAVVLSFLGRLATAAAMPTAMLAGVPERDLLQRSLAEQAAIGLTAGEVGRLLMADWGVPAQVAAEAADIDRVLVVPRSVADAQRLHRQALGYLCARLGERLAAGELDTLVDVDLGDPADPEWFHLRAYLADARLQRVAEHLRQPALSAALQRTRQAWKPRQDTAVEALATV